MHIRELCVDPAEYVWYMPLCVSVQNIWATILPGSLFLPPLTKHHHHHHHPHHQSIAIADSAMFSPTDRPTERTSPPTHSLHFTTHSSTSAQKHLTHPHTHTQYKPPPTKINIHFFSYQFYLFHLFGHFFSLLDPPSTAAAACFNANRQRWEPPPTTHISRSTCSTTSTTTITASDDDDDSVAAAECKTVPRALLIRLFFVCIRVLKSGKYFRARWAHISIGCPLKLFKLLFLGRFLHIWKISFAWLEISQRRLRVLEYRRRWADDSRMMVVVVVVMVVLSRRWTIAIHLMRTASWAEPRPSNSVLSNPLFAAAPEAIIIDNWWD